MAEKIVLRFSGFALTGGVWVFMLFFMDNEQRQKIQKSIDLGLKVVKKHQAVQKRVAKQMREAMANTIFRSPLKFMSVEDEDRFFDALEEANQ